MSECNASLQLALPDGQDEDDREETGVMRCDRKRMGHQSMHESAEGYAWFAAPSTAEIEANR